MLKLISGSELAKKRREEIKEEVIKLKEKGITPGLAVILVGEDPASQVYVRNKENACKEVGFYSEVYRLPEETTQEELLALIDKLNNDDKIHGLLVQLPVPKHIDETAVIHAISPRKDVDGFLPENLGSLLIGEQAFEPCTPKGCIELIKESGIDIAGKKAVVVGRSNIVGKPVALMLSRENATVTICHSHTKNLKELCKQADILIVAIGKSKFVDAEYVKPGAVVIDVGMDRDENGKLCGDVDFASVEPIASKITPVPGGVGPMTIAMLMHNCVEALSLQK
jgi:methylenetetrahydrofolate dehydrogenase (NADP+)/methenyltetrahydrofolate cyclohydrolase